MLATNNDLEHPDIAIKPNEKAPGTGPGEVYRERIERYRGLFEQETQKWNSLANARLVAFLVAVAAFTWGAWRKEPLFWGGGLALFVAFFVLVRMHSSVGKQRRRFEEMWKINSEAESRLLRRWDSLPVHKSVRAPEGDPFANDLNIFGHASLFQLVQTTGTFMGEGTLARWLQEPALPDVLGQRQEAVAELAPLIDLRDELHLRGRLAGEQKPDPARFLQWAESKGWLSNRPMLVWVARGSVVLLWPLLVAYFAGLMQYPLWILLAAFNIVLSLTTGDRAYKLIEQAASGEKEFRHYAGSLELLAETPFAAAELKRLQEKLGTGGTPAHAAMRKLYGLTGWMVPRSSQLYVPIQGLTMWDIHLLGALERWQVAYGRQARSWLDVLGEAEALASLAALSHSEPAWTFPTVDNGATQFEAADLGHPLLPGSSRVTNDVKVGPPGSFLLVTGSNMSGKSTLLRSIGVNIVLAQAGGPMCASAMSLPPVELWTSMRIEDSLEHGVSYFMAELQRLKRVVDAARDDHEKGERRVFYLLDEILQGTNTAERQIAARRVIMYLVAQGALGAVSTHDLNLADLPEVAGAAQKVHFTETFISARDGQGPQMLFDYKLRPGIATSTNALRLMEMVGLDLE